MNSLKIIITNTNPNRIINSIESVLLDQEATAKFVSSKVRTYQINLNSVWGNNEMALNQVESAKDKKEFFTLRVIDSHTVSLEFEDIQNPTLLSERNKNISSDDYTEAYESLNKTRSFTRFDYLKMQAFSNTLDEIVALAGKENVWIVSFSIIDKCFSKKDHGALAKEIGIEKTDVAFQTFRAYVHDISHLINTRLPDAAQCEELKRMIVSKIGNKKKILVTKDQFGSFVIDMDSSAKLDFSKELIINDQLSLFFTPVVPFNQGITVADSKNTKQVFSFHNITGKKIVTMSEKNYLKNFRENLDKYSFESKNGGKCICSEVITDFDISTKQERNFTVYYNGPAFKFSDKDKSFNRVSALIKQDYKYINVSSKQLEF